jgi:hypothetical protein
VDELPLASAAPNQLPIASASVSQPPDAVSPVDQQAKPPGFQESDCNMSGIEFEPISFDYIVDDVYDGPYLTCSYSGTNTYGLSETVYFSIGAYKPDKLEEFYQDTKENISGYVAQSNEWNAHPDLSAEMKDVITILRDDTDGYIFMIAKNANVQGCTRGDGFGVEKVNGKYLVKLIFTSCVSDAPGYLVSMNYLKETAESAIKRVEAATQP